MPTSVSDLVATIRSCVECVNNKRWDGLLQYIHSTYNQNGSDYTPESLVTLVKHHLASGDIHINEDSLLVDERAQCVSFSIWTKLTPEKPFLGQQPVRREVLLIGHSFVWFTEGKISKSLFLTNNDDMRKQLASLNNDYAPDLIRNYPVPEMEAPVSRETLEEAYRGYVDMVNSRRTETDYAKYVHKPDRLRNNKAIARRVVEDTLAAMPDLYVEIHTIIADAETQRVAVWLDFTGTPVKDFAGLVADGRAVHFNEHATYQFVDGKIQKIWGIMDLDEARQQQRSSRF